MESTLAKFKQIINSIFSRGSADSLDIETIKQMARGIATTHPDEIDCDRCFEEMDQFVEMTLAGKNAAEALPLVQEHLVRCKDCREEFEALLAALRAVA